MDPDRDKRPFLLFFIILIFILFIGLFTPIRERIAFHLDDIKSRVFYQFNRPEDALFVPQEKQQETAIFSAIRTEISATEAAKQPTATSTQPMIPTQPAPTQAATDVLSPTATELPTAEPTKTLEPLPASFFIEGVRYEDQHGIWNYCAPTNLSMIMNFWGWKGDRMDIGPKLKPFNKDKNVMYYELQDFVSEYSDLRSIVRPGGSDELLKRLIVNGFPVLIEKGSYMAEVSGRLSWMGHYNVITGYDEEAQEWTVQDSYYTPNYKISYETLDQEWRAFNYQFMIVYPGGEEANLYKVLGMYTNNDWAVQRALEIANAGIVAGASDEDLFFAYFNRGSTLVELQDYNGAALAYDMAFEHYANIENSRRPYRMVWYQTGPYYAYYYSGRYYDVISLAETTIASTSEPYFEETYYWRAMAYNALGEVEKAHADLDECLTLHSGFPACETLLHQIGY